MSTAQIVQQQDAASDELNEFRQHLRTIGPVHRRILSVLMPQLVALEEAGDADAALSIIEKVRAILLEGRRTRH
jgi:glutamine synthetase adenylyltransferase